MTKEEFKQHVVHCGCTGDLVQLPNDIDHITCGNIMADVAASFLDGGEDIKAIIILQRRSQLGI